MDLKSALLHDLRQQSGMANLQIDANLPELTPVESLSGWRREFCIELLGDADARAFVRKVEQSSFKATELQRATLFHRLPSSLVDLAGAWMPPVPIWAPLWKRPSASVVYPNDR